MYIVALFTFLGNEIGVCGTSVEFAFFFFACCLFMLYYAKIYDVNLLKNP